ncbi:oxidoreductase [Kocuria dechangensis]|uniref:Propionate 3-nitronate monooxygenase n=1 Tax=Kocuria dechangensis TaxID=1176249 RepID=A0A917LNF6_9MICC|nr:nitronate monooxygenase [Kocuria dechangensis]GGG46397.1 oxidoreductase [Kocuria dechangensis]
MTTPPPRFDLTDLAVPFVGAPMAGGPSSPALAAAVTGAGGLGFLAAGYRPVDGLREDVAAVRALTGGPFGVNLFVPQAANTAAPATAPDPAVHLSVAAYRDALQETARRYGVELPATDPADDDGWAAKLDAVEELRVPVVSFTFGLPATTTFRRLAEAGITTCVTVTSVAEAEASVQAGADLLTVQGPAAGGHRGTHRTEGVPGEEPLAELVGAVRAAVGVPLVAAGGIASAADAAAVRAAGADAVQVGTLLLRTPEAGTPEAYREALVSGRYTGTAVTRAFSGRLARGVRNGFIDRYTNLAPAAYPQVNQLTRPIRAAAARAGDAEGLALWASPSFAAAPAVPAAEVVRRIVLN